MEQKGFVMDTMLLRAYQGHVVHCCNNVIFGAEEIQKDPYNASGRLWYGIQNVVIGAGNLSKTLWGTGPNKQIRQRRLAERKPLRDSLGVKDDSPIRKVKIRNDYEHLDERIEDWWNTSTNRNLVTETIGPPGSVGGDAIGPKDMHRQFDPTTGDVRFWGNELNIPSVLAEVLRIYPIAVAESRKPHWDDPFFSQ
jgi:hypothetical protein